MSISEITVPRRKRQIYLLSIFLASLFFALTFYFHLSMEDFSIPFAYVFLGISALCFISGRLETCILIILIITSTVFEIMEFTTVPIQIGDLYLSDLLIVVLLLGRLLKRVTCNVIIIPKPMGYPVLASILIGIFSFAHATLFFNVPTNAAGIELRSIFYMALFFLVIYYVRSERQLRSLLLGIGISAAAVAVLLTIQHIVGTEANIVSGRVEILSTAGRRFQDVTRVAVPGSSIMFFTLNTLIAIYILKGLGRQGRALVLPAIALLALGMVLTFTRIFWVMILIATIFLLFIARRRMIIYPRISVLIAGATLGIVLVIQSSELNSKVIKDAILTRTVSILKAPSKFKSDTLFMRYLESRYAWEKITHNPILGIGLGNSYRPLIFGNIGYEKVVKGTAVHNGYLATQLKMGLPGTIVFLWLIATFLRRILKRWRKIKDPFHQTVALGIAISVIGMLAHNAMASPFLTLYWVPVAAVGMGVVEKIYKFEGIS